MADQENNPAEKQPSRMQRLNSRRNRRNLALGMAATTLGGLTVAAESDPAAQASAPLAMNEPESVVSFTPAKSWDIEETRNEEVDFFIDFLRGKNHDKTKLWLERLGKYGPMIQAKPRFSDSPTGEPSRAPSTATGAAAAAVDPSTIPADARATSALRITI